MVVEANTPKRKCNCLSCELRNLVFTNLEEEDVRRVCESKEEFSYAKGEIIHSEGDPIHYFKYLKTGLVKLFRLTPEGDEQVITITRPFEFVSNTNVFHEDKYSYSLSALEDSVVCCVRIEFIKELILRNGKFALNLISSLSRTMESIISLGLEIRKRNLAGRTAFVLLYFSNEIYHSRIFELPVSRKEIADLISMSSANVIRTFSEFRRDGIIRANGRTIEITDMNKLEVISRRG
ncbi:MAG: Crp/Fnr family transcriptional regulator [Bacteroidales bacterium]|jgi:CRP/FNR family transcriptional regulator|nr:Crp/Fnr family transcriptional regulator [Bacteroidales bacterium]MDX9926666.1 Crp/Fnr family transcriptional regulator [Bacteroidales bacterium]HNX83399.1 Crp/Fnr family transcriptional regulator [Bacteroidales bacterium]HOC47175.1 Crp/Fnr family transcriptional regulator [Bacteroidales bacterium]HPS96989.1 Crp/Fnr family transcriptional regulator [Bacteroidales bacterium]